MGSGSIRLVGTLAALAALATAAPARPAAAQSVRGTVVDRGSGAALGGVVVQLLDSTGAAIARAITSPAGTYRVAAPREGTYALQVLRLGYRPSAAVTVTLHPGPEVAQPPLFAGASVALDTVRVAASSECQLRPVVASATFDVWEQIRAALAGAQATLDRRLTTTVVAYERALDSRGDRVLRQSQAMRSAIAGLPWRAIPADSLSEVGYAVTDPNGATTYFAPDLAVLTSDLFLAEHCLRLVAEDRRLGIVFEPVRSRRNLAEIEGTLWIDRQSLELRSLDFRYVNVTRHEQQLGGGLVEFQRMRDGGWLISRWNIRAPVLETRLGAGGALREGNQVAGRIVREVREEGGVLSLAMAGRDTLWTNPAVVVEGRVVSPAGNAVPAARVAVRGTGLSTLTDSTGRFRIQGVIPGAYLVEAQTDALAATGARESQYVSLIASRSDIVLHVPADSTVVARSCAGPDRRRGMLGGEVLGADSLPPGEATLTIEWNEFDVASGELVQRGRAVNATTDARGRFRVCDIPLRTRLVVRASGEGYESQPDTVLLPPESRFAFASLGLTQPMRTFVLAGRILSDVDATPIENAEVLLPALGKKVMTSADGSFLIRDIPEGIHEVNVRRIGFRQGRSWVSFGGVNSVQRNFALGRATALDTIAVTAQRSMAAFAERREAGLGQFVTRAELERHPALELPSILARLRGVRFVRGGGSATYVVGGRGGPDTFVGQQEFCARLRFEGREPEPTQRCQCYVQVYLDNMMIYGASPGETVPDINTIPLTAIEALEYYVGPQTPAVYNRLNSNCGVLIIHTRRGGGGGGGGDAPSATRARS